LRKATGSKDSNIADFLRPLLRSVIQEFLEGEMPVVIGEEKGGPLVFRHAL
jgi:hypothetical protein